MNEEIKNELIEIQDRLVKLSDKLKQATLQNKDNKDNKDDILLNDFLWHHVSDAYYQIKMANTVSGNKK